MISRILDKVVMLTVVSAVAIVILLVEPVPDYRQGYANARAETVNARMELERHQHELAHSQQELSAATDALATTRAALQSVEQHRIVLEAEVRRLQPLRTVTTIIVHHTDCTSGDVPRFDRQHREKNKWDGIGYHYLITNGHGGGKDGEIQFGRDEDVQGAHAKTNHRNEGSIGVCLVGCDHFTAAQQESLRRLLAHLCRRHVIQPSSATIQRHHDRCPGTGLNLEAIIRELGG